MGFVAVGSNDDMEELVGDRTEVIDLGGSTVLPGLIDGHGHYMSLGESLMQLDLRPPRTWDEIVALVADAVTDAQPGDCHSAFVHCPGFTPSHMYKPPLQLITWPVIYDASSEHKNATIPATSSAEPTRDRGIRLSR